MGTPNPFTASLAVFSSWRASSYLPCSINLVGIVLLLQIAAAMKTTTKNLMSLIMMMMKTQIKKGKINRKRKLAK